MKFLIIAAAALLAGLVWQIIKAAKDPDVQIASDLKMPITRYRKYKEVYDEIQAIYREAGPEGIGKANDKVDKIIAEKLLKTNLNMNEWRRYSNYRLKESSIVDAYEQWKKENM